MTPASVVLPSPGGPESVAEAADRVIKAAVVGQDANPRARIELLTRMATVLDSQGQLERARKLLTVVVADANERFGEDDALSLDARRVGAANAILRLPGQRERYEPQVRHLLDGLENYWAAPGYMSYPPSDGGGDRY